MAPWLRHAVQSRRTLHQLRPCATAVRIDLDRVRNITSPPCSSGHPRERPANERSKPELVAEINQGIIAMIDITLQKRNPERKLKEIAHQQVDQNRS